MRKLIFILLATFSLINYTYAEEEDKEDIGDVKVEIISEIDGVELGTWFNVAVKFEIEEGWHIYWKNPGDSGLQTEIEWEIPEGFKKVGKMMWDIPERIKWDGMVNYGFEEELVLIQQFQAINTKPGESYEFKADINWLICKEKCIPQDTSLTFEVAGADDNYWSDDRNMVLEKKQSMVNPKSIYFMEAKEDGDKIVIHGEKPLTHKFTELTIFPITQSVLSNAGKQEVTVNTQDFQVIIPKSEYFDKAPETLEIMVFAPEGFDSPENKAFEAEIKFNNDK